jgi:hypothetical protein
MTAERYNSYCAVVRTLRHLSLRPAERDVLRDAAEGFLLCRDEDPWELAELGLSASIVLDRAVSSRRVTREIANRLAEALNECGPMEEALVAS